MHKQPSDDEPPYLNLVYHIEETSDKLQLPEYIYRLRIECCQEYIAKDPYPEFGVVSSTYKRMANLYRHVGDLTKAAEAEQKAKDALPQKTGDPRLKDK